MSSSIMHEGVCTIHTNLYSDSHSEKEVLVNFAVLQCKNFSTNQNANLLMLDDPGRVRSQLTSVVFRYSGLILIAIW